MTRSAGHTPTSSFRFLLHDCLVVMYKERQARPVENAKLVGAFVAEDWLQITDVYDQQS